MPTLYKNIKICIGKSPTAWRNWLEKNHAKEEKVWLVMFKKNSGIPSLTWEEAVDEAICFGWIDSVRNSRDENSFYQYFAKRKPKSGWSDINKKKVERLLNEGKIAPAGLEMIQLAKSTGTWDTLNEVETLAIPPDLQSALKKNKTALKHFNAFPASTKRAILQWLQSAKKEETRKRRIAQTVAEASQNIRTTQTNQPKLE
ncbi:MAG TPA: YdeI/OmpD-associated family protein [Chitinophagales bacterium]|nr:YdeI/OmpD-associated family protein [Chitinophagales bacterium]